MTCANRPTLLKYDKFKLKRYSYQNAEKQVCLVQILKGEIEMFKKIGTILCVALIFFGVPAHAEVSLNQEDDFALLANHVEVTTLLALKGAGPAGSYQGNDTGMPENHYPQTQTQTQSVDIATEDEFFAVFIVMSVVTVVVGIAYLAVYGVT